MKRLFAARKHNEAPCGHKVSSSVCRYEHFQTDWYHAWRKLFARALPSLDRFNASERGVWGPVWASMRGEAYHRKVWEWCAIAQALDERGLLQPGHRGCGFAVGLEPLSSAFAARGVNILATDLGSELSDSSWTETSQHASSLSAVHWPGLIPRETFEAKVNFSPVDMRDLSALPRAGFDFLWSSCSFEHLGSLEHGLAFVTEAMGLLRAEGIAVHTTEYNVSSNEETLSAGQTSVYRRRDIEDLDRRLRRIGCGIEAPDFNAGTHRHDLGFDLPPYYSHGRQHVKLILDRFVCTSMLLIIHKGVGTETNST